MKNKISNILFAVILGMSYSSFAMENHGLGQEDFEKKNGASFSSNKQAKASHASPSLDEYMKLIEEQKTVVSEKRATFLFQVKDFRESVQKLRALKKGYSDKLEVYNKFKTDMDSKEGATALPTVQKKGTSFESPTSDPQMSEERFKKIVVLALKEIDYYIKLPALKERNFNCTNIRYGAEKILQDFVENKPEQTRSSDLIVAKNVAAKWITPSVHSKIFENK